MVFHTKNSKSQSNDKKIRRQIPTEEISTNYMGSCEGHQNNESEKLT